MDYKQIAKQMIQFNKTAFDNSFNAMNMIFQQSEKMAGTVLDKASWVPDEGKKAIQQFLDTYKTGCDNFKSTMDDNFKKVEDYFTEADKKK